MFNAIHKVKSILLTCYSAKISQMGRVDPKKKGLTKLAFNKPALDPPTRTARSCVTRSCILYVVSVSTFSRLSEYRLTFTSGIIAKEQTDFLITE